MEFWASSETFAPADVATEAARQVIEPLLQRLLGRSRFAATEMLLRYVPIVMPAEFFDRYPSRSKARVTQGILDCGPHLDYETFVRGNFTDQVIAYLNGIRTASLLLPKFGFSLADVGDFEALLVQAQEAALASHQ